jgi:hypothetical protein
MKCQQTVWTDISNISTDPNKGIHLDKYETCEVYNSSTKLHKNNTDCTECCYCFICVFPIERSIFKLTTNMSYWKNLEDYYVLMNDETGSLVLVGNRGKYLIKGSPWQILEKVNATWKTVGNVVEPTNVLSGILKFNMKVYENVSQTMELITVKVSNVSQPISFIKSSYSSLI